MTMTDSDEAGKLFVGGLSWETTKEILQTYFSKFGEVVDSVVMKNNETGRSRGFGFVTFKDPACISLVLQTKPHELNGRTVDPKECTPRSMQKNKRNANQGKVFLGGLPPDITETDIRSALSKFGKVTQISIMCDQDTKKCRGFGFLSFESEESTEQACAERFVNINGKQIECKKAEPRENSRRNAGSQFGNQNGVQPGYGAGPGYQGGWNQTPQSYGMQANAYGGGYPGYSAPAAGQYGQMPYNATPQAPAYAQQGYGNYGGMPYGYAQTPPGGNYTQPAAVGYGQQPAAANTYAQGSAPAFPPAMGGDKPAAAVPAANTYGGGYTQTSAGAGRGQGYHPYRR